MFTHHLQGLSKRDIAGILCICWKNIIKYTKITVHISRVHKDIKVLPRSLFHRLQRLGGRCGRVQSVFLIL